MELYNRVLKEYEKGVMGYSVIAIIFQVGLGSVAVMLILKNGNTMFQMLQLMLVTALCMTYNATILSQQKPKISFATLVLSVLLSIIVIALNLT